MPTRSLTILVSVLLGLLAAPAHAIYDPGTGRWLQRDPIGYVDGTSLYQYVKSRSIDLSDPMGLTGGSRVDDRELEGILKITSNPDELICLDRARKHAINSVHNVVRNPQGPSWNDPSWLPWTHAPGGRGRFIDNLINGPGDAVRHCVWNCLMSACVGTEKAKAIADNHEDSRPEEDQNGASGMDRHNNQVGRDIFEQIDKDLYGGDVNCRGRKNRQDVDDEVLKRCIQGCNQALDDGRLKTLDPSLWKDHGG